uniref:Cytochrome P450 n=1 Tax=Stomoxys calcitrans TaxID=35570 RepID=A0A1I8PU31_STOCA
MNWLLASHLHKPIHEKYLEMCATNKPCTAIELFGISALILQDHEAVEEVLVKQFEHFNERGFHSNLHDPLTSNLGRVGYDMWKWLRKPYISGFSNARTREFIPSYQYVGEQMLQVIDEARAKCNNVVDVYDLCQRYAIDLICRIGFGLDGDCLRDPNALTRQLGVRAIRETTRPLYDQISRQLSGILQFFHWKYHSKPIIEFFTKVMSEAIKHRHQRNSKKTNDFIDVLIQTNNDPDVTMTKELMLDQVFGVFAAGFDNTSCAMTYILYELAKHPEIQERARQEILTTTAKYDHKITYDSMKDMNYTFQVIQETLRKDPVGHMLPRTCLRPSTIRTSNSVIHVPARTVILLPIYSIHRNPKFYPQPDEFRPERFDEREMAKRPPCSYLTFGDGPRKCVAYQYSRASLVYQVALLLMNYRFSMCDATPRQLTYDKSRMFTLSPPNGMPLKVEALKNT